MSGEKQSLATASEGHDTFMFDGIFRDVHSKQTRNKIQEAQTRVTVGDWSGARYLLEEALEQSRDPHDVKNVQLILDEVKRYQTNAITPDCKPAQGVDWDDLLHRRPVEMLFESWHDTPQSVFFIRHEHRHAASDDDIAGHVRFTVGRRILSHQFRSGNIRELHCSLVTPSMLLGTLEDQRMREDGLVIYFRPFSDNEKLYVMQRILGDLTEGELVFPFPVLQPDTMKELSCPPDGWEIDEPLAEQLGQGEVIIREYSQSWLKSLGRDDLRLYDPACSTGQFLATMREALPRAHLIGQDLSAHMVSYAKKRLDEIYCGNAVEPKISEGSCDVCFVRFLNSEVVKVKDVLSILTPLSRTVKVGGHLVVFGHTPVLLSAADLRRLHGWTLLQCLGGGEVIIREYSQSWLKSLGRDDLRLYDPACSTGQFLATMREALPRAHLIGQDLSAHMVSYAKKRLDEIYCGNAVEPKISEGSCDVCFVRFLNSEVVKVKDVLSILTPLSRTVKVGGHLVVFGHTPVLLSAADLRRLHGWTLLQCLGEGEVGRGVSVLRGEEGPLDLTP